MWKYVSVLCQKPTKIYGKNNTNVQVFYFWLSDESPCLNICTLNYLTMECTEIKVTKSVYIENLKISS